MTDDDRFPAWPPEWLEDHVLSAEETLAEHEGLTFRTGLRNDGHVLMSVSWPEGRRWMRVDPVGHEPPRALRIGELSEDADTARMVEGVWSQALTLAKQLIDGEITELPTTQPRKRRWGRG